MTIGKSRETLRHIRVASGWIVVGLFATLLGHPDAHAVALAVAVLNVLLRVVSALLLSYSETLSRVLCLTALSWTLAILSDHAAKTRDAYAAPRRVMDQAC